MKLNRLYIGFTNDGKEVLVEKRIEDIKEIEDIIETTFYYYDIINGKKYFLSDIDEDSLIKYSTILEEKNIPRRKVVKHYKLDRKKRLNISKLVIGDIRIQGLYGIFDYKIIENRVFINNGKLYEDLITGKKYYLGFNPDLTILPKELLKESSIISAREFLGYNKEKYDTKKKILERNYSKYKGVK